MVGTDSRLITSSRLFTTGVRHWRAFRQKFWLSLLVDVLAIILVFVLISSWQSRHLLAADGSQFAPKFSLSDLQGQTHDLQDSEGRTRLLYFFAPWCHVCALSAPNLEHLRSLSPDESLSIMMVALSYEDIAEVEQFVAQHELSIPVLLGNDDQIADYRIRGFPTYYVVDAAGQLRHRSVGYSTTLGMLWRTWSTD